MDNNSNRIDNIFNLTLEGTAKELLQTAATWARITAIASFVSAGVSVLVAIIGKPGQSTAVIVGSVIGALIGTGITILFNIFLLRFATNTTASFSNMNQVQFNEGISNLRTYFKIVGIFVIIGLSLAALVLLVFGLGLSMRR